MAVNDPTNGEGRVTLAIIRRDIDGINSRLDGLIREIREDRKSTEERLRSLENCGTRREERIDTLRDEVKSLRAKSDAWNLTNTAGAVIAGILGALGLGK